MKSGKFCNKPTSTPTSLAVKGQGTAQNFKMGYSAGIQSIKRLEALFIPSMYLVGDTHLYT